MRYEEKAQENDKIVKQEKLDETDVTPEELAKYVIVQIEESEGSSFYSK